MKQKVLICLFVLISLFSAGTADAQTRIFSGKVTSSTDGSPLSGVSVQVVGSRIATQTDGRGNYSISVPTANHTLLFSYIGYVSRELSVSTLRGESLNIILELATQGLDEVIVTGGGLETQRRALGNASTTINAEQITQGKSSSFAASLSGKVPGLQVNAVNGGVNPNYRLVLRGQRSITGNNQALLVVDNLIVPQSLLGNLNPEDIEDIQVLNGAGAAAVYGSDASNGAIVIRTKKGKPGETAIKLSNTTTAEQVSYFPQLQTRFGAGTTPDAVKTYTPYENQQYGPEFDGSLVQIGKPLEDGSIQTVLYSPTNAKKDFWANGLSNQTDLSLTSGDDRSTYYLSGQYFTQTGVVPDDKYQRISVRANGTRKIYHNFDAEYQATYIQNNYDLTTAGASAYNEILQTPANVPLTSYSDWRNDPYANPNGYYNDYYDNPYFSIGNWRQDTRNEYFQGNLQLRWKPVKPLTLSYRIGISSSNAQNKSFNGAFRFTDYTRRISTSKQNYPGNASDSQSGSIQLVSEFLSNYKTKITDDIGFDLTLAGVLRENNSKSVGVSGSNLVIDDFYNISNSANNPGASESTSKTRQVAVYGDARFSFKNYLFLHVTARNDWRSVLAKNNWSFFYPSVDASFIASDAIPALQDAEWLTSLKLRGGYAYVGNVNLGAYALNTTFGVAGGFPYAGRSAYTVGGTLVADNLKPEITKGPEAGFDIELFNGDITAGSTWYKTNTYNQTFSVSVSVASGYNSLRTNIGEVSNEGIESYIRFTPIRNKNGFTLSLGANHAYNKNEVISLSDEAPQFVLATAGASRVVARVGQPFPLLETTRYNRDDQGRIIVNSNSGLPGHDGTFHSVGITNPPHILGADLELRYKGFRFTSLFEYRTGNYIYNSVSTGYDFSGSGIRTTWYNRERFVIPNSSYLDAATGEYVDNTNISVRTGGADFWTSGNYNTGVGENHTHSAAFWKLREATLSYNIPAHLFNGKVKAATISAQGRNLFIWSPKTNLYTDPEYSAAGSTSNAVGITTLGQAPPARYFGGTVTISF